MRQYSSVGPPKRHTKVWSLQAVTPQAGAADPRASCDGSGASSATRPDTQWLQCTAAAAQTMQRSTTYKKKKRKKKGGGNGDSTAKPHRNVNGEPSTTQGLQAVQSASMASDAGLVAPSLVSDGCIEKQHLSAEMHVLEAREHEAFLRAVHVNARQARPQSLSEAHRVAKQGEGRMRTKYGSVQEAAALLEVLHMFKYSTVHEAGLCMLDPDSVPEEWGIDMRNLQVGASPDALIFHPPRSTEEDAAVREPAFASPGRHWHERAAAAIDLPGHWEVVEVKNHCPYIQVRAFKRTAAVCFSVRSQVLRFTPETASSAGN